MRHGEVQKVNPLHINKPLTKALVRLLDLPVDAELPMKTKADKLAAKMFTRACQNSFKDTKEILDRIEGKVANVIAGDPNNPIKVDVLHSLQKAIERYGDGQVIEHQPTKGAQLIEHAKVQSIVETLATVEMPLVSEMLDLRMLEDDLSDLLG